VSMPGFRYGFLCPACGEQSDDYPAYRFPNIFEPRLILPAWSRELRCYGEVICRIAWEERSRLEKDLGACLAFAARLSSPAFTVGVPRLLSDSERSGFAVEVTPSPSCPFCGASVEVWFGEPPRRDG